VYTVNKHGGQAAAAACCSARRSGVIRSAPGAASAHYDDKAIKRCCCCCRRAVLAIAPVPLHSPHLSDPSSVLLGHIAAALVLRQCRQTAARPVSRAISSSNSSSRGVSGWAAPLPERVIPPRAELTDS